MRAVRYYGPADIRVDNIPEPSPRKGEVKIKVACIDIGVGYADLTYTHGMRCFVMGHEFSGTVVELGPGTDNARLAVGSRVVVEPILSCMKDTCPFCSSGARNLCRDLTFIGIGGRGGGLSEYICVEQRLVFPLPEKVPLDVGAMMEPLSIAWHGVKRSNFKPGDSVLILGAGPIGQLALRVVKALGASWIGISEPALKRREIAALNGASAVFDPTSPGVDIVAETLKVTGGRGVDVVFDCAGNQRTLDTAFLAVRPRGSIMNIAVWGVRPELDIGSLTAKEVVLSSILGCDRVHAEMLDAIADGTFPVDGLESLVTRRIPFEDVVDRGIKALLHETDQHVKILVSPDLQTEAARARL